MTNSELELLFNVILENDSVIAGNQTITRSGNYSISLFTDSTSCPKELNGFIYVPKDSVENTRVLIHNVRLMRYHKNSVGEKMPDLNHVRKIF